jgi:hypothetical protein
MCYVPRTVQLTELCSTRPHVVSIHVTLTSASLFPPYPSTVVTRPQSRIHLLWSHDPTAVSIYCGNTTPQLYPSTVVTRPHSRIHLLWSHDPRAVSIYCGHTTPELYFLHFVSATQPVYRLGYEIVNPGFDFRLTQEIPFGPKQFGARPAAYSVGIGALF